MSNSVEMSKPLSFQVHKLCPLMQRLNLLSNPSCILHAESYFCHIILEREA